MHVLAQMHLSVSIEL